MTLRTAMRNSGMFITVQKLRVLQQPMIFWVYWEHEDNTTVVKRSAVKDPPASKITVGMDCRVKLGSRTYPG